MIGQRQILLSTDTVPRTSIKLLSLLGHVVGLFLIVTMSHSPRPQSVPEKYIPVPTMSRAARLAFSPTSTTAALPHTNLLHIPKNTPVKRRTGRIVTGDSASLQILRGQAKRATAGLIADFKFSEIYGFPPRDYRFAVQTSGVLPTIRPSDLPPRFEQYLTVEVTVDIDGHVADARLVAGEATPKIEQRLLSAIREFKYIPAKRDGFPIASQMDVVVHIPS
jgi:hypothetical protein